MIGLARKAMGFFPLATPAQRARQAVRYAYARFYLGDKWILHPNHHVCK